MLLSDDAELVRMERELPGLATALDPEAITEGLRHLGARSALATYVRYKPGGSATVAYRIGFDGTEIDAYVKAFKHGDKSKATKVVREARPSSTGRPGAVILHDGTVAVALFPNDHDLPALKHLDAPDARRSLLRSLFPGERGIRGAGLDRLRYKPERRYVARVTLKGEPRAVLKLYERDDFNRAFRSLRTFALSGRAKVPALLGACQRRQALAFEWLSGMTLDQAPDPGTPDAFRETGAALAALHVGSFAEPGALARLDEINEVRKAARALEAILPEQREAVQDVASRIAGALPGSPVATAVVHGDFSPDQVLVAQSGISFIDLDDVARGEPAADLGSFGAALWRDAIFGTISSEEAHARFGKLLSGYRSISELEHTAALPAHLAARVLRLAPEPFRFRDPQWRTKATQMLERAQQTLASKDPTPC